MKIRGLVAAVFLTLILTSQARLENKQSTNTDSVPSIEMVLVKGGCYQMGDTFGAGNNNERPVHEVCVDDFYLGKYEVTQGQWKAVMGNNPSFFKNGDNYPVENVDWYDALGFIQKLKEKTGKRYRLPKEAEWEYASRSGGKKEKWAGTSNEPELGKYAWYNKNAGSWTHPAGEKKPNELGLYDMSGNVSEWCQDSYSGDAYLQQSRRNPVIIVKGSQTRVFRGGSWITNSGRLRATYRNFGAPGLRTNDLGFRLARDL